MRITAPCGFGSPIIAMGSVFLDGLTGLSLCENLVRNPRPPNLTSIPIQQHNCLTRPEFGRLKDPDDIVLLIHEYKAPRLYLLRCSRPCESGWRIEIARYVTSQKTSAQG